MSTPVKVIHSRGLVATRADVAALIPNPGDYALVVRGHPRWLILRCPSGCGEEVVLNVDPKAGPAWRLYSDERGLTVYPSIIRETGCHSHFVIWDDRVLWCGSDDTDDSWFFFEPVSEELPESILVALRLAGPTHYLDLAESLREIPWQILNVCRSLKKEGLLHEGTGRNRGVFGYASGSSAQLRPGSKT